MSIFDIIKQKVNILSVINEYITLKKIGSYYKGRCPFHSERTASFTVSPDKGIFYCFGCQAGGDVIFFVSKIENCTQLEAAKVIQEKYNIDLSAYNFTLESFDKKKIYINVHEVFLKWVVKNLNESSLAQDYLTSRSINKNSVETFQIGFMPGGQQAIKSLILFAQKNNILASDLVDIKVLYQGKNGMYSPFEDRIIFPIKDHLGNLVGFGGRVIKKDDERAKYYNSHDNKFFNKGSLLFGLNLAKSSIQKKNAIFLVEGYLDVILMFQHDFTQSVATLGTACTKEHLSLLARYANRLYLLYDQDNAGQKAIMRVAESCWQVNIDLYVINLPKNDDPASFLAKNLDLKPLILKAKDIFSFYIDALNINFFNSSLSEKMAAVKKIIDIIGNIEDQLKQNILLRRASEIFDINFDILKSSLDSKLGLKIKEGSNDDLAKKDNSCEIIDTSKISQLEKKIIATLVNDKVSLKNLSQEDLNFLTLFISESIKNLFIKLVNDNVLNEAEKSLVNKVIIESGNNNSLEQLILSFYKKQWKVLVDDIKFKIKQAEKYDDKELISKLLNDLALLKEKILKRGING